jgi:serine/threonine protein kinase
VSILSHIYTLPTYQDLIAVIREDEFAQLLQSQQLWPVDPSVEHNWSDRGQHVAFQKHEQGLINRILEVQETLGSTRTAVVQSVKCRRILLARKSITCGLRTMTKKEAVAEVAHITRLNHAHIIRVIGTYVKGAELSILLYPVADENLETFLERTPTQFSIAHSIALYSLYGCLSSAVHYIHLSLTKHMDIKPQNILIVKTHSTPYVKTFISDFGIARAYQSPEDIETDGWTSFTKRYAAPEVVKQEFRGLPADIFSLGCVFLEILQAQDRSSTIAAHAYHSSSNINVPNNWLQALLKTNPQGDASYQGNIGVLQNHLTSRHSPERRLTGIEKHVSMISMMLNFNPKDRPAADNLVSVFGEKPCCKSGAILLEAVPSDTYSDTSICNNSQH